MTVNHDYLFVRAGAPRRDPARDVADVRAIEIESDALRQHLNLALRETQRGQDWIDYCSAKYRSFDPASGTYLGYDGERHYCR